MFFNNVYLDEKGNKISFEQEDDVFSFNRNNEGEISLQKKTLELAKAHYRQKVYSSLQINQERMNLSQEELDKQQVGGNDLSQSFYKKYQDKASFDKSYDKDWFRSSVLGEYINKADFNKEGIPGGLKKESFDQEMAEKGYSIQYPKGGSAIDSNLEKIILDDDAMFNGFNVPGQKKKSAKKLNEFLNITSTTGLKYNNINSIIVVTGIEGNPQIFVSGNATASKKKSKGEGDAVSEEQTSTVDITNSISKPLSSQQVTKLFEQIKNYPSFQDWVNLSGNSKFNKSENAFDAVIKFATEAF